MLKWREKEDKSLIMRMDHFLIQVWVN